MEPAFRSGGVLVVRSYGRAQIARGDVVTLRHPGEPDAHDLKRVVGLPGETLRLADGALFVDGVHLPEPYLGGLPASPGPGCREWTLADDEFFALSDNRAHGTDSRHFGPALLSDIVGRALFRIWPPSGWGRSGQ